MFPAVAIQETGLASRAVIVLHYLEEMSLQEVAAILDQAGRENTL